MKRAYVLAIDQGTTSSRALIFREDGKIAGQGSVELPQIFPKPGWVSHDPDQLLGTTLSATKRALACAGISGKELSCIGVTNQRETTLIWDRKSSKPIAPAVVWQCRRTADLCEALKKQGLEKTVRRRTGLKLDAYFSGTKIRWLLDHTRGAADRARQGKLAFGTVDSWLIWCLTGAQVHATDFSNASRTLLFNIRKRRWDPDLLKQLKVPGSLLPEVHASAAEYGRTVRLGPLPAGIPITAVAGDQQAALFGQGCTRPGQMKNTYGTGCFLVLQTGDQCIQSRHGLLSTLACGPKGEPTYALEGSVFVSGAAVQWLRDGLNLIKEAQETEAIASGIPDTGGVYLVPAFVGLGAPYWDQEARAALVGMTRGTGRAEIVRAALESMAYQTVDVVQAMARDSGLRFKELRVDGGASRNKFLMQFQADLLGLPVVCPSSVEFTAKGVALLAGIQNGIWEAGTEVFERAEPKPQRFLPGMKPAVRCALYAGWQEAVGRVRTCGQP
ncbi:MAG: glycerol kinase GlpK [Candidatus Omnitrophica bacterium]|nr:glycerol kinase GlpK [Candidatus Omnitrophota bacterium]